MPPTPTPEPLLLIKNSDAGTADEDLITAALDLLRAQTSVEVRETSSPEDLDEVLRTTDQRRVIVAGGDGSLHAVLAALHRTGGLAERTLGLLPLGTGNDFARTLGIPLEARAAAQGVLDGTPRPMDLIVDDTGGIVVNNVHLGAGADASKRGERWKERLGSIGGTRLNLGRLGYPIGTALTMLAPPRLHLRIEVDGERVTGLDETVLMVALGNGSSVGGGTDLTPGADPADGWIDIMIATPDPVLHKARYAAALAVGRHPQHRDVATVRGTRVSVTADTVSPGFWCTADGEIDGPCRQRSWELLPKAYSIIAPAAD